MPFFKKTLIAATFAAVISVSAQAKITVFAASSMTNAIEEATLEFLKSHPKDQISLSFASSSKLARQIENGAPANIFISANQKWMNYLQDKNAIVKDSRIDLVSNSLVMIAPENSKVSNVDLKNPAWVKLLGNSYLAVGDPEAVPAGRYAKEALTYLKEWDAVKSKLARAQNVRVALAYVERGESPLGIVYATDAKMSKQVKIVATFPADSHAKILYPAAIVKGQDNSESREFLSYLASPEGKKIFERYGFVAK